MSQCNVNGILWRLAIFAASLVASFSAIDSTEFKGQSYVIETRVLVDRSAVDRRWLSLDENERNEKIKSIFFHVGEIYKSLELSNISIKFAVTDITYLNLEIYKHPDYSRYQYFSEEALSDTIEWNKKDNSGKKSDMTLLLTGYDLYSAMGSGTNGQAEIGAVCSKSGVAVSEIASDFQTSLLVAHELGHVLGINHDGTLDSTACDSQDFYLMSAFMDFKHGNQFYFSPCSIKKLKKRMKEGSLDCLKTTSHTAIESDKSLKELMSADYLCERMLGEGAYTFRRNSETYWNGVCKQLYCHKKDGGNGHYFSPPEGMTCGEGKRCVKGVCTFTGNGTSAAPDFCTFGDQPVLKTKEGNRVQCSSFIKENPTKLCQFYKWECCASCKNY